MLNNKLLLNTKTNGILEFECGLLNKGMGVTWYGIGNDAMFGDIGIIIKNTYNIIFNNSGVFMAYDGFEKIYSIKIFNLPTIYGFIFNNDIFTVSTSSSIIENKLAPYFKNGNKISLILLFN